MPTGTLDISKISFGENSYDDGNDWEWERRLDEKIMLFQKGKLVETLEEDEDDEEPTDWNTYRVLGAGLEIEPVDADDLGDWYSDYERRLQDGWEDEGDNEKDDEGERRRLGQNTLDISSKSFGENEYWDSGDW